ncbi:MAG: hypothetical protein ACRDIB_07420 [Ardenticatenaceae bacterium]
MTTEQRIARLEGAYEQVSERLGDLRSDMNSLRSDMNSSISELRSDMNGLRSDMNSRFSQMLGIMGVGWATLMAAILAVLFTR